MKNIIKIKTYFTKGECKMLDIVIVGAGPAGLSAAINAKARNRTVLVLGRDKTTSWIYKAHKVNNHLGMPGLSGKQLIESFYNHAKEEDIEIRTGKVMQVMPMKDYFGINFNNDFIESKTVILSTGVARGKYIEGEKELLGKGVSYCATCDGMFYKEQDVVVVGETEEGEEEANFLSELCKNVYYIPYYKEINNINTKIKVISGKVSKVIGEGIVEGVEVNNNVIECQGVFFAKASTPMDSFVHGIDVDDKNAIKVNRNMETNIKGLYAAGDCIGWPLQISNAIGEGLIAAQSADKYLRKLK